MTYWLFKDSCFLVLFSLGFVFFFFFNRLFFIALEDSLVMSFDLPLVCVFNIKEKHTLN